MNNDELLKRVVAYYLSFDVTIDALMKMKQSLSETMGNHLQTEIERCIIQKENFYHVFEPWLTVKGMTKQ